MMVEILLATYNGKKYLKQQLDSLLNQTFEDFKIIIRDDSSKDKTMDIIMEYKEKYPEKIKVIEDDVKCGSSVSNFMQLIKHATAPYIMFCDQDDYWLPNKIEISLKKMRQEENDKNKPILIYTDYKVVDSNLNSINIDKKKGQIYKEKNDFTTLS